MRFEVVDHGLPVDLVGDEIRLKQVLVNLTKYVLRNPNSKRLTFQASFDPCEGQLMVRICNSGAVRELVELQQLLEGNLSRD